MVVLNAIKVEDAKEFVQELKSIIYCVTLKPDKQVVGCFDNVLDFETSVKSLPDNTTLYFNAQGFNEEFLKTVPINRFEQIKKGGGLKDINIMRLRYIVLDIDVTSKNVKSKDENGKMLATNEENAEALSLAKRIEGRLKEASFVGMGIANSGNGAYVIIPMKATKQVEVATKKLCKFIATLNKEFAYDNFHIDEVVTNPARIFKMPGTISKKGIATEELLHRYASIISMFDFAQSNSWKLLEDYVEYYGYATNLLYENSKGEVRWDMDCVCKEAVKFFDVFRDQYGNLYAQSKISNIVELGSPFCNTQVRQWLRTCTGKEHIPKTVVEAALDKMEDDARSGEHVELFHRVRVREGEILYNLGGGKAVKVTPAKVELVDVPQKVFWEDVNDEIQVTPDLSVKPTELPELMKPFFNIKRKRDWIHLSGFLGTSYTGISISHPALFFEGSKGAAKSTATRNVQSLVSPKTIGLLRFPTNERELGIILNREMFVAFDNLGGIKRELSDTLCQAVTGSSAVERKYYTNNETVVNSLKAILVLNGISLLSNREDLLDRTLLIHLERVESDLRKTDKELKKAFDKQKPKILGAIFNALKEVMTMQINPISYKIRLLDYEEMAIKFCVACGWSQQEVEEAFKENSADVNKKVVEEDPTTLAILNLMERKNSMSCSATALFNQICTGNQLGLPKSPNALSRKIEQLKSELAGVGITYVKVNNGHYKDYTIVNDGSYVVNFDGYVKSEEYKKSVTKTKEVKKKVADLIEVEEE